VDGSVYSIFGELASFVLSGAVQYRLVLLSLSLSLSLVLSLRLFFVTRFGFAVNIAAVQTALYQLGYKRSRYSHLENAMSQSSRRGF
jgi:hypothetical protein